MTPPNVVTQRQYRKRVAEERERMRAALERIAALTQHNDILSAVDIAMEALA